jgi:malonyl CoA-acyl carrier protein transacylase
MRSIEGDLHATLAETAPRLVASRAANVASNLTGSFHVPTAERLIDALTRQASRPVQWIDDMQLLARSAGAIVEIGPSRPLRRFFAAIGREVVSVTSARDLVARKCA